MKELSLKSPEIYPSFLHLLQKLEPDLFIMALNQFKILFHAGENDQPNLFTPKYEAFYEKHKDDFEHHRDYIVGTKQNSLDLTLAGWFQPATDARLADEKTVSDKLDTVQAAYPYWSRSRDSILLKIVDEHRTEVSADDFERLSKLIQSPEVRFQVGLWLLETQFRKNPKASIKVRLRWVKQYLPDRSLLRDDVLENIERDSVSTAQEMRSVLRLKTRDASNILNSEVARLKEMEDNMIVALSKLDFSQKQEALLWLMRCFVNGVDKKPDAVKNLEVINYLKLDYLRDQKILESKSFKNIGLSQRRFLLKRLLLHGGRSVIESGGTEDLLNNLWKSLLQRYKLEGNPKLILILQTVFNPDFAIGMKN